jgi:hypothetical protein
VLHEALASLDTPGLNVPCTQLVTLGATRASHQTPYFWLPNRDKMSYICLPNEVVAVRAVRRQVTVTLHRSSNGTSPLLYDIAIRPAGWVGPDAVCAPNNNVSRGLDATCSATPPVLPSDVDGGSIVPSGCVLTADTQSESETAPAAPQGRRRFDRAEWGVC